MPVIAVVGAQWGDEGKGKIVDVLAQKAHVVVRSSGGNNAGHTVINEYGEFAAHIIPVGIFNPETLCIVGGGTVLHPRSGVKELEELTARGISLKRLLISSKAHLILPWHIFQDEAEEKRRSKNGAKIGTTLRGIGPAYSDKAARINLRAQDLLGNRDALREKFFALYELKRKLLPRGRMPDAETLWQEFLRDTEILAPFVCDIELFVWEALEKKQTILLEGAQGTLLDVDDGTYPYVTSTGCTAAALAKGAGIPPQTITRVVGVVKAYCTRVGEGPFPTEMDFSFADEMREKGKEYGATTGRPRRIGWLDVPLLRYAHGLNGFTELVLTKLDVFSGLPRVMLCTEHVVDGRIEDMLMPTQFPKLSQAPNLMSNLRLWDQDLAECVAFKDFPCGAREFVEYLEKLIRVPIRFVSTGPQRHQMVMRGE